MSIPQNVPNPEPALKPFGQHGQDELAKEWKELHRPTKAKKKPVVQIKKVTVRPIATWETIKPLFLSGRELTHGDVETLSGFDLNSIRNVLKRECYVGNMRYSVLAGHVHAYRITKAGEAA